MRWVVNGRIVNNNTNPQPFADQTYYLREQWIRPGGVEKWFNLTITNPTEAEVGQYLCVAENNGGVMERKVELTFKHPDEVMIGGNVINGDQLTILIGVTLAVVILFIILVTICCYFCLCRRRRKRSGKKSKKANRVPETELMRNGFDSQKLLPNGSVMAVGFRNSSNPLPKPPRTEIRYDHNGSSSAGSTSGSEIGGIIRPTTSASYIENEHYPDLLNTTLLRPPTTSPPNSSLSTNDLNHHHMATLNPANLMMTPQQQVTINL